AAQSSSEPGFDAAPGRSDALRSSRPEAAFQAGARSVYVASSASASLPRSLARSSRGPSDANPYHATRFAVSNESSISAATSGAEPGNGPSPGHGPDSSHTPMKFLVRSWPGGSSFTSPS